MSALAPTLQAFFTDRLIRQRHASPNTIAAYRDAFKLLLGFIAKRTGIQPSQLDVADLDAATIAAFLDHLEADRGNSVRSRNARLAAIRSLFHFAALRHPEHAAVIERVLAIPPKRFDRALIDYLSDPEIDALLAARAAVCAESQGRFWALHSRIFAGSNGLNEAFLRSAAIDAGLQASAYDACMQNNAVVEQVRRDVLIGRRVGVDGTPAFFLNQQPIDNPAALEAAVEKALAGGAR